ncbi:hypothetical protein [Micromonospora peucetia]|uniref:Uncharacterized protein n=1 Tax=Micromonospora peucetia TaxID=47871 RepID=A0ABZ1EL42_9ACTN|nr:hypothetical protein [Micromonospora peucetia]WSA34979.1 hypothetical protein OIE14_13475 [Micromonospora peucetia]
MRKKIAHLGGALAFCLAGVVAPQTALAAPPTVPAAPSAVEEQSATVSAEELDPQTATMIPEAETGGHRLWIGV